MKLLKKEIYLYIAMVYIINKHIRKHSKKGTKENEKNKWNNNAIF